MKPNWNPFQRLTYNLLPFDERQQSEALRLNTLHLTHQIELPNLESMRLELTVWDYFPYQKYSLGSLGFKFPWSEGLNTCIQALPNLLDIGVSVSGAFILGAPDLLVMY